MSTTDDHSLNRREFLSNTALAGSALLAGESPASAEPEGWFGRPVRWAQLKNRWTPFLRNTAVAGSALLAGESTASAKPEGWFDPPMRRAQLKINRRWTPMNTDFRRDDEYYR